MRHWFLYFALLICFCCVKTNVRGMCLALKSQFFRPRIEKIANYAKFVKALERSLQDIQVKNDFQRDASSMQSSLFNNLIILFDPSGDERKDNKIRALVTTLARAIEQEAAPIIVTHEVLGILCNESESFSELNDDNWFCYGHRIQQLMLLIPKKYVKDKISAINAIYDVLAKNMKKQLDIKLKDEADMIDACGFNMRDLDKIKRVSAVTVANYIDQHGNNCKNFTNFIADFESLFTANPLGKWNIYLMGHGKTFVSGITVLDMAKLEEEKQKCYEKKLSAYKQGLVSTQTEEGIEKLNKKIGTLENKIRLLKLNNEQTIQKMLIRVERDNSGAIIGLGYTNFCKLISFFKKRIVTSYLHYASCFSSGFNRALAVKAFAERGINFLISSQGINESPITANVDQIDFMSFFWQLQSLDKKDLTVEKAVKAISGMMGAVCNQPFIYLPSVGRFNPLLVKEKTKFLTHAIERAHMIEGATINFANPLIRAIFIYPHHVRVTVSVAKDTAIISAATQAVEESTKSRIHIFEKISYSDTLQNLIAKAAMLNNSYSNIVFVIKQLHCLQYDRDNLEQVSDAEEIDINDVVISVKKNSITNYRTSITVFFTRDGKEYFLADTIIMTEDNGESRWGGVIPFYEINYKNILRGILKKVPELLTVQMVNSFISNQLGKAKSLVLQDHTHFIPRIIEELEKEISHEN